MTENNPVQDLASKVCPCWCHKSEETWPDGVTIHEDLENCTVCGNTGLDPAYAGLRRRCDRTWHYYKEPTEMDTAKAATCANCAGRGWIPVDEATATLWLLKRLLEQRYVVEFMPALIGDGASVRLGMVECDGNVCWLPQGEGSSPANALADAEAKYVR